MRVYLGVALPGLAMVGTLLLTALPASSAPTKLTCTAIDGRCRVECGKQASGEFCAKFCRTAWTTCMKTGRWETMGRVFENVRRR